VDVVNEVVPQLIAKGKFPRPGIGIVVLDDEKSAALGIVGVVIDRVMPNSEAERAGLEGIDYGRQTLGDVIVEVEGKSVTSMDDFIRILQNLKIGETITLGVQRSDMLHKIEVTIMDIS